MRHEGRTVMSAFTEDDLARVDWALFQNSWVTLYWKSEILESDCGWLVAHGYRVHRIATDRWTSSEDALRVLGEALAFPDPHGQNLDAFSDCLSDIDVPMEAGTAIVLSRYDHFAAVDPKTADAILEIMSRRARQHMLFGRRLAILVQTDDPKLSFGPLAPMHAWWNRREWLKANRGL
jgi:RNAse (barnase) inhibitor barstar